MLPKALRYNLRRDRTFFQTAQKKRGSFFTILFKKQQQKFQGAVIVGKKTAPTAAQRNFLKRQVKSVLSPTLAAAQKTKKDGLIAVILILRPFKKDELKELQATLHSLT